VVAQADHHASTHIDVVRSIHGSAGVSNRNFSRPLRRAPSAEVRRTEKKLQSANHQSAILYTYEQLYSSPSDREKNKQK